MIDFAHFVAKAHMLASEEDTGPLAPGWSRVAFPPSTKGPDNGYLLGLCSLIHYLQEILVDFRDGSNDVAHHVKNQSSSASIGAILGVDSSRGSGDNTTDTPLLGRVSERVGGEREENEDIPSLEVEEGII
ncbi:hypothetical protein SeLEV6574_g05808 [Synchytrium endobioticum]|uniref:Uncharacterized protein n=1 Tax=Synchytrium endobioticum TaxID=286115 RepID=A0A507CSE1_9FUNG|nr:hypothetical protein SeLEV6574_g05808 [Synchytrium endobioticum]